MKTEQEFWDEYMKLLDAQVGDGVGKHFKADDPMQSIVYQFMKEMNEAGLEQKGTNCPRFTNRFFSCKGRTFSICKYANGKMELRWG
jgi:hypothetical protein